MLAKRIAAAIIDFLLGIVPMFILCNIILGAVVRGNTAAQAFPLVVFLMLLSPIGLIQHVMEYPRALGIPIEQLYLSLLVVFLIEVLFYSAFELSPMRRTIGKALMHISYAQPLSFRSALTRNMIKTLTRYLFGIPLIFVLFSKRGQALHDVIIQNSVIRSA